METVEELLIRTRQLSFDDRLRLLEKLAAELRSFNPQEKQLSWEEFIDATAGSLADDPIEHPSQGELTS